MNRLTTNACVLLCLFGCALTSCSSPETSNGGGAGANATGNTETPKVEIRNLSTPFDKIMCSGQPTEEQFDSLKAAGVSRVVNLRMKDENGTGWEEQHAKDSGIEFVRLEINGKDGLTRENVDSFAKLLAESTNGSTLVSCGSSNRVGAMFALKAYWVDKLPKEEALAIGTKAGMKSLQPAVEALFAK